MSVTPRPTKQAQNNKVNGSRIICISNYLECKWAKPPTKRHRLAENGLKSKAPSHYAVYERSTSDLGTHTGWKWGPGER